MVIVAHHIRDGLYLALSPAHTVQMTCSKDKADSIAMQKSSHHLLSST